MLTWGPGVPTLRIRSEEMRLDAADSAPATEDFVCIGR